MKDVSQSTFVFASSRPGSVMGRVERRLLRVMAALRARGATVLLICAPRSPMAAEAREHGIEVAFYALDRVNFIRTRSRMRKYFKRFGPDVAHSTGVGADLLVRHAASGVPTRVVNTLLCSDWPRGSSSLFSRLVTRKLDARSLDGADMLVCDCARLATRLADSGVERGHILVDPPSIDIAEVMAQSGQTIDLPRTSVPLVGYGGRIEESRGLETLVAASAILEASGVLAQVVVAGEGPLLRTLRDDVRSSHVRYIGWVDSVPAVLRELTVAVFPSTRPGVPTSLLEAAALGKPIVASRVEGIDELFEDGREIRLVPPGDPKALSAAIADLMSDPEEAADMGERARHRTIDEYSSDASIDRHLSLYRELMSR
ncbi:MAG: glycosyltransferase [Actinomycetota bacterium]|nr:glycosyltransferase [Actinomycetota bacterium]